MVFNVIAFVNQCANRAVFVTVKIIMVVLGDCQKACRDKHNDEFTHVQQVYHWTGL
jgi:hypothetical protein